MKAFAIALLIVLAGGIIVSGYFYFGGYNMAATEPHTAMIRWFLNEARDHSIRVHAADIEVPSLDDPSKIELGASHYHEMCTTCHGAPGIERSEIGQGLYPEPPDLAHSGGDLSDRELFWVVQNGIKMTGMPAFGPTHDEESLWGIVAFLKALPGMSKSEYEQMLSEN